jgi:hypothetical protein
MNPYTQDQDAIKELAQDVEKFMRRTAAERGVSYTALRGHLAFAWFGQPCFDDDEIQLLQQAQLCQNAGDAAGFRAAGLAFLMARHGAQIGDLVNLHGFSYARNVTIEDFYLELDETDLHNSKAVFIGPCLGDNPETRHVQAVHKTAVRSQHAKAAP